MGSKLDKTQSGGRNQNENKEKIPVYYNKKISIQVNREDLLEKSSYFRAILKICNKDHESDDIDISIPAVKTFQEVMKFINTGEIDLKSESLFYTLNLALYLQIESLQKFCLDHFTYNLNRKSVESQLRMLEEYSFVDEEYKRRAACFHFQNCIFCKQSEQEVAALKCFPNTLSKHTSFQLLK